MNSSIKQTSLKKKTIQDVREDIKRIVIDADWLLKVKCLITDVIEKKVDEMVLRKEIYQQGERVVESLLALLPFIIKLLHKGTENKIVSQLQEELREKTTILEEVDTKLNSIYAKLTEKSRIQHPNDLHKDMLEV